jgi:hypothetical protein
MIIAPVRRASIELPPARGAVSAPRLPLIGTTWGMGSIAAGQIYDLSEDEECARLAGLHRPFD